MIAGAESTKLQDQRLWLLPQKAIYWPETQTLLAADLHIGKASHFRKNGISVPSAVNQSNLDTLSQIVRQSRAERLIILGDLFHSDFNHEWNAFRHWRSDHQALDISLVIGNHDILDKTRYHSARLHLFKKMRIGPFLLVHDAEQMALPAEESIYLLSGHVHPAIKLTNRGRQRLKLSCFFFGQNHGILPAFGQFTGTHILHPGPEDRIFIVTDRQVMPCP